MSRHILTIEVDGDEDRIYSIRCPEGNGCSGWIECDEPHEVDGVSAADGPDAAPCDEHDTCLPWCEEEEFTFHGELHTWRYSPGWTVPYKGCVVQGSGWEPPDEARALPPGEYVVDDDWNDEPVTLHLIEGETP